MVSILRGDTENLLLVSSLLYRALSTIAIIF